MSTCPHCWQPTLETESISHGMAQQYCQFCGESMETEITSDFVVITPDTWSDEFNAAFSNPA